MLIEIKIKQTNSINVKKCSRNKLQNTKSSSILIHEVSRVKRTEANEKIAAFKQYVIKNKIIISSFLSLAG